MSKRMIKTAALILLAALFFLSSALGESYEATTMRLLRYDGSVEILDASGNARFVMENARFNSGESMQTGSASSASVGLDSTKIVTLDAETQVDFAKEASHLQMTLRQGTLFLDVQEKLDENEVLDIQTTTMTVGIRGTIVFISEEPEKGNGVTTLGVLEGTAQISYADPSGAQRLLPVPAGHLAVFPHDATAPVISELAADSLSSFVINTVTGDPQLVERTQIDQLVPAQVPVTPDDAVEPYPAAGDWSWDEDVTFIAQSASKLYDGEALTRSSDVLIYGLPELFTAKVSASGSQTNAGKCANEISEGFRIYNSSNEDVTSHFKNIHTVAGLLQVDPVPLTIWTGSAEKIYDGTELTNPRAGLETLPPKDSNGPEWRNSGLVSASAAGSQTLYVTSGVIWAHGTNPLTGEIRELEIYAGQRLTIFLRKDNDQESIEFQIDTLAEDGLPDAVLRLYAENPALLTQACMDTGWSRDTLSARIRELPEFQGSLVTAHELLVAEEDAENLLVDNTDIRITIDTDITNYNARPLNTKEAHFYPVMLPTDVLVTATGSQLEVGESINTYVLNWGTTNPVNYVVSERLGTLTVLPVAVNYDVPVTVTAASRRKVYDGTTLSTNGFKVDGLPDGYSLHASVGGRRTSVGSSASVIQSYVIYDENGTDVTSLFTDVHTRNGSLTVTPASATITTDSASKMYDGTPLTAPGADISGLAAGESATVTATGSITEIGTATNTYSISWGSADPSNYTVSENLGTLEVTGYTMAVTITAPSGSKVYDGDPLFTEGDSATVTGLPAGFSCVTSVTGSQTNAGTSASTVTDYVIYDDTGADVTSLFSSVTRVDGTLTVTPAELIITTGSQTKTYNGDPLMYPEVSVTGLIGSDDTDTYFSVTAVGSITDAGTQPNSYSIDWGTVNPGNYTVTGNLGTLTVTKAPLQIITGSDSKEYDGTPLTKPDGMDVFGLYDVDAGDVTVTATGSITDVGTAENTYTIDWGTANGNNYEVSETLGTLAVTINTDEINITSGSATKQYDGTPLTESTVTVSGLSAGLQSNCSVSGSQTAVGASNNTIDSYQILDSSGKNVTSYFDNISKSEGLLTVDPNSTLITITAGSAEKPYDGTALTAVGATVTGLPDGFRIDPTLSGSQTAVGDIDSQIASYKILNSDGEDVTAYFNNVQTANGILTVTPASLTIQTSSAAKTYDGTPLTSAAVTVTGLANGETLSVTATGTITDANSGSNTYSIDWSTSTADPSNYTITAEELGTLTVSKADLRIFFPDDIETQKTYDGTALTAPLPTIEGLADGENIGVDVTGSITDVGETPISCTVTWGTAKESNYNLITDDLGTLKITPADLYIHIMEDTMILKPYDGTELTVPPVIIDGLAEDETATVTATGSITDVGSIPVVFSDITWGTAKAGNYNPIFEDATLTVIPAEINIIIEDLEKDYDGEPLTYLDPIYVEVVVGETIIVIPTGSITDAGEITNAYTIDYNGVNPGNYTVTDSSIGKLTVHPRPITVYTDSVKAVYNGQPVTAPGYYIDDLVDGETLVVVTTGTLTERGSVENTCYIDWENSTAKSGNYDITFELGTIFVN
ncbi:MAG: FecR domain-containing protein [Clostridiales bacterium]|nr:FecR domain-containing protein [Clostridiales bacterium]